MIMKPGLTPSIVLINPKTAFNVSMIVRLASAYGLQQVWYTGDRISIDLKKYPRLPREERMKGYKDVDIIQYDFPLEMFGREITPVAVEVRDNSSPLHIFDHPENAVYVFGPEDGSIPKSVLKLCHRFITIPVRHCLNLATAVATILWDREYKNYFNGKPVENFTTPGIFEGRGLIENEVLDCFTKEKKC